MTSHSVLFSLGSNVGDRRANLRGALAGMGRFLHMVRMAPVYETTPMYVTDQAPFLNMAAVAETVLSPDTLLGAIQQVEERLGRIREYRNGPRIIDIDIVLFGDRKLVTDRLTVPHASMAERAFVLGAGSRHCGRLGTSGRWENGGRDAGGIGTGGRFGTPRGAGRVT